MERELVAILKKFFRCCGENVPIETGFRCGIFKANHAKSIRRSRPSYGIYAKPVTVGTAYGSVQTSPSCPSGRIRSSGRLCCDERDPRQCERRGGSVPRYPGSHTGGSNWI